MSTSPRPLAGYAWALAAGALAFVTMPFSMFSAAGAVLLILPVYLLLRYGYGPGILSLLLCLGAGFFWNMEFGVIETLLAVVLPVIAAVRGLRRKAPLFETIGVTAGVMFLGKAIALLVAKWGFGVDLVTEMAETMREYFLWLDPEISDLYFKMMMQAGYLPMKEVIDEALRVQLVDRLVFVLDVSMRNALPVAMVDTALVGAMLGCGIPLLWVRRYEPRPELTAFVPFERWRIPHKYTGAMAAALIPSAICYFMETPGFGIVVSVVWEMLIVAYAAQGISFVYYLMRRRGARPAVSVLITVLCALVVGSFMGMLGMVEQIFDWRGLKRVEEKEKQ